MSRPLRRSHACLAMMPPASDSRDHAGRSRVQAAVPALTCRFGVVPYVATKRQRSRATRARHLFAWECPSSGKTDRNPARTHRRDPKGPHPSVTKPEGHFHFLAGRNDRAGSLFKYTSQAVLKAPRPAAFSKMCALPGHESLGRSAEFTAVDLIFGNTAAIYRHNYRME